MEGENCSVLYRLSVSIDRSLARDPKEKANFEVVPLPQQLDPQPVVARYPDEENVGFWARTFGKKANLTLVLDKDAFVPGDTIECMLGVETESVMNIRQATARLLCVERTRAHGHSDTAYHHAEPVVIAERQEIEDALSARFMLEVESVGPPTTSGHVFDVDWYVEVTLDVPWAKDPTIRAPIRVVFP